MAERLASYPFRCHWPDEVSNEPPGVWVEMPGFVAVERPSELFFLWLMDQRNEAAMRLYESLGFKDTGGREAELLKR